MNRGRKFRGAFTLLEILLVIAILVILAGSVTVMLIKQFDKGKVDMAKAWASANGPIAHALDLYKKDNQTYPDTTAGLAALVSPPANITEDAKKSGGWPYISGGQKSLNDPWGNPYQYECPGKHNTDGFDLWSKGPDGKDQDGSVNNLCNWDNTAGSGGVTNP